MSFSRFARQASATLLLLALTVLPAQVMAQAMNYTVLPFEYMGPEKYQHYGRGIRSVLNSKLNLPGKFEPAPDDRAQTLGQSVPATTADGIARLSSAGVDYMVYGLISMAGETATVDMTALGVKGNTIKKTAEMPHDQLSLKIDSLAREITNELFADQVAKEESSAPGARATDANPTFLSATNPNSVAATTVNPQFRYEGGAQTEGRWQTQGLRFGSTSFQVCDGDGDGNDEVFLLTDHALHVYRIKEFRFDFVDQYDFSNRAQMLRLSSIDINKDGAKELVVTTLRDEMPRSYVVSFKSGKLRVIADNLRYFLSVVRVPPTYSETLFAQPHGHNRVFNANDVTEAMISGDNIVLGKRYNFPPVVNVFNFTYLPEGDSHKLVTLDQYGYIKVFDEDMEIDFKSMTTFNGSANAVGLGKAVIAGLETRKESIDELFYYIPMPMLATNMFTGTKKFELLLNSDISVAAQVFKRFRTFTQGEVHAMFWDGTGLNLSWKTRRIKGTVVGYQIGDPDNDGKKDLCILVNTYPGVVSLNSRKTVLFAYQLDVN